LDVKESECVLNMMVEQYLIVDDINVMESFVYLATSVFKAITRKNEPSRFLNNVLTLALKLPCSPGLSQSLLELLWRFGEHLKSYKDLHELCIVYIFKTINNSDHIRKLAFKALFSFAHHSPTAISIEKLEVLIDLLKSYYSVLLLDELASLSKSISLLLIFLNLDPVMLIITMKESEKCFGWLVKELNDFSNLNIKKLQLLLTIAYNYTTGFEFAKNDKLLLYLGTIIWLPICTTIERYSNQKEISELCTSLIKILLSRCTKAFVFFLILILAWKSFRTIGDCYIK